MKHAILTKLACVRRFSREAGQAMTEYIIVVAVIAIASIAVYSYFGDTLRHQTSAAALALSGESGKDESGLASGTAGKAKAKAVKNLKDFAEDKDAS